MNFQKDNQIAVQEALAAQDSAKQVKLDRLFLNIARLDKMFLNIAREIATMSHCTRSKVGAVLVKDSNIISFGYNGMPTGMPNCCEDSNNTTFPHVIHAESNAIIKAAKTGNSTKGGTLYLTLSPCLDCSKLILQSEIKRVVYLEDYRDLSGIEFLSNFIKVEKYEY